MPFNPFSPDWILLLLGNIFKKASPGPIHFCINGPKYMIVAHQASVVDRIIDHLKISFRAERPPPASDLLDLPLIADPPVDYFS